MERTYVQDPPGDSSWQGQSNYGLASREAATDMNAGGFVRPDGEEYEQSGDEYEEETAPKPVSKSRAPVYRGIIQDEFHYERLRNERIEQETSAKMGNVTMPTSTRMKECARLLFEAIINVEGIVDKTCKGGKICQAGARILAGYYPGEVIEMVVWEVVVCILTVHNPLLILPEANILLRWLAGFRLWASPKLLATTLQSLSLNMKALRNVWLRLLTPAG